MIEPKSYQLSEFGPERVAAVEKHLTDRLRCSVVLVGAQKLTGAGSSRAHTRSFWTLFANVGGDLAKFHARAWPNRPSGTLIDEELFNLDLPVPAYFGAFSQDGVTVDLWSHHPGRALPDFAGLEGAVAAQIARAVAKTAAVPKSKLDSLALRRNSPWIKPIADDLRGFIARNKLPLDAPRQSRSLSVFLSKEKEMLDALQGGGVLTHNDLKAPNVLLGDDVTIVDWESATLGHHGASLRRFSYHGVEMERLVANAYVKEMNALGVSVDLTELLRVMRYQEIFWCLGKGIKKKSPGRIARGLKLLLEVLDRPANY